MTNTTTNSVRSFPLPAKLGATGAIRLVEIGDKPWFVASDVMRTLGYDLTGGTNPPYSFAWG